MKFAATLVATLALFTQGAAFVTPSYSTTAVMALSATMTATKTKMSKPTTTPVLSLPSFGKKAEPATPAPKKGALSSTKTATKTATKTKMSKPTAPVLSLPSFGKKAEPIAPAPKKAGRLSSMTLPAPPSLPTLPVPPTLPTLPPLLDGGVVGVAGKGMSLLSPIFSLEAKFQAAVTGFVGEIIGSPFRTNPDDVRADIKDELRKNKAVIYTYELSPFSSEALNLLKAYDVEVISMGAEWFLPGLVKGPENSERRVALEEMTGSTSLPKLFVNGVCYGGFSTGGPSGGGIASLASSGQLAGLGLKKKPLSSKKKR